MTEHVTEKPTVKRLERSRSDRMLAGVCGGLASYFDIHPAFYRVGFVVLTLLGGSGILIYVAAALVVPDEGKTDSIAAEVLRERRDRPWPLIGLALAAIAGTVLLSHATLWPHGDAAWTLILVAGLAILWAQRRERRRDGSKRHVGRWIGVSLLALIVAALVGAAAFASWVNVDLAKGVGDRSYVARAAGAPDRTYELGFGDLTVDLRDVDARGSNRHVEARLGIGDLRIVVPRDARLDVHASARLGDVTVLGEHVDGHDVALDIHDSFGDGGVLHLDAHVGAGQVDVVRAVR